jgi:hypothetical protein
MGNLGTKIPITLSVLDEMTEGNESVVGGDRCKILKAYILFFLWL